MRGRPLLIATLAAAGSILLVLAAVLFRQSVVAWCFALLFVAVIGLASHTALLGPGAKGLSRARLLQASGWFIAVVYAWGGLTLNFVYRYGGLHWQHGWQYGLAMLLIAASIAFIVAFMQDKAERGAAPGAEPRLLRLTVLHGIAAAAALLWLALSGKLNTPKEDWAANIVFVCGGLAVVGIAAMTVRAAQRAR